MFAGVHVDPLIGAWAIANGPDSDESGTSQLLHFEDGGWKVKLAVVLAAGADSQSVRLTSISGDGSGKLLAVGTTRTEPTGVILRGDGLTFSVTAFDEDLRAVWCAGTDSAFIAGGGGRIFRSAPDGGWANESAPAGDFVAIWGSGPRDVYVGGSTFDEGFFDTFGHLGHRTVNDAGVRKWSFRTFAPPGTPYPGFREIRAGVASGATRLFTAPESLARLSVDGGVGTWTRDAFTPPVNLNAFWARTPDEIWVVGDIGRVYRFDGASWTDAFLVFNGAPLTVRLTAISGASSGELFVVGENVALRRAAP
jgi:hypothetical protein